MNQGRERDTVAKKVKQASDLPRWFDLKKYSQAGSLDAAGWYEQLTVRKRLLTFMDWRGADEKPLRSHEPEFLSFIREMPIIDVTANDAMMVYFYDGAMHENRTQKPNYSLGVRLSTVRDLYLVEGNIDPDKREYARKFFSQIFDKGHEWLEGPSHLKYPCTDWIDKPIDAISSVYGYAINVQVDLGIPDKVLIEQFRMLLEARRKPLFDAGIELAPNRRASFTDWISFGVLPFIDLKIWERETGTKIPNRVMADAIFPAGVGGEEVVRKTTSKIADELMTDGNLKFLAAIAGQRFAEPNNG